MRNIYIPPLAIFSELEVDDEILNTSGGYQGNGESQIDKDGDNIKKDIIATDEKEHGGAKMGDFPWDDEFEYHIDM